ncbi:MAG TPA: helix-turn-helix domain-containing protein [Planctomycetes bacterium]|nr:helix-turn-helix domain-containing protein [Planctomycetota bacterium]HIJ70624.1 helix-turn-helix domain-containing protein [Planctomycetota bacterium]
MKDTKNQLLTAGELGDILDISSGTIIKWAKEGKIPSFKLPNKRFIFDQQKVLDYLEKKRFRIKSFSPNCQVSLCACKMASTRSG